MIFVKIYFRLAEFQLLISLTLSLYTESKNNDHNLVIEVAIREL